MLDSVSREVLSGTATRNEEEGEVDANNLISSSAVCKCVHHRSHELSVSPEEAVSYSL